MPRLFGFSVAGAGVWKVSYTHVFIAISNPDRLYEAHCFGVAAAIGHVITTAKGLPIPSRKSQHTTDVEGVLPADLANRPITLKLTGGNLGWTTMEFSVHDTATGTVQYKVGPRKVSIGTGFSPMDLNLEVRLWKIGWNETCLGEPAERVFRRLVGTSPHIVRPSTYKPPTRLREKPPIEFLPKHLR